LYRAAEKYHVAIVKALFWKSKIRVVYQMTDRYKFKMSEEEERKCQEMIRLFSNFFHKRGELCAVKAGDYGYVIFWDISHGCFESNIICRDAKTIYRELMQLWEVDYLYYTGRVNGCSDFDAAEEAMTPRQREYQTKMKAYYKRKAEEILSSTKNSSLPHKK